LEEVVIYSVRYEYFFLKKNSFVDFSSASRHTFKSTSFTIPKSCDYCKSSLWGLSSKQGYTCTRCGYNCHLKCELKIPPNCGESKSNTRYGSGREKRIFSSSSRNTITSNGGEEDQRSSLSLSSMRSSSYRSDYSPMIRALVLYSYVAQGSEELSIQEGEIVNILSTDNGDGWIIAQSSSGMSGLTPANYVKLLTNESTAGTFPSQRKNVSHVSNQMTKVRVLYDYNAQSQIELTIRVGDIIEVTNTQITDCEGWWEGKMGLKKGQFPANYVESIDS
jgi:hypothetical protein